MNNKITALILFILALTLQNVSAGSINEQVTLSDKIQPITDKNIFRDTECFNWCSSIIKGRDGKYHMFYSRWERCKSFDAWLTHSTIAHAISDNPEGPYKYHETVLDFEKEKYKAGDMITAHNPKIKFFNGKYYIYFISTKMNRDISNNELLETAKVGSQHKNWKILRENQRTYVAVCEEINGKWEVREQSLLSPEGPIQTLVVNPAVTQGPDKRFYMIVKGDKPGATNFERNQALAISDYPDSSFVLQPKPVIEDWDSEDVSMWYDNRGNIFYAVFHAHTYIGMMCSKDGINWERAKDYIVMKKRVEREGRQNDIMPDRLERPFVYVENNIPKVLSLAVLRGNDTYIVTIPLKNPVCGLTFKQ